jgi:hypothetical protein
MKHFPLTARRAVAAVAGTVGALAISSVPGSAYAATSSSTAPAGAAAVPRCAAGDLGVWIAVSQGNGAAGTIYFPLQFTNLSRHTCTLFGYPGVSALDRNGRQLGSPANWASLAGARTVYLAPGATAHTLLAYHDAAVTTEPGCDPVFSTALLRVYPPDQRQATFAEFSLEACSHAGPIYMSIIEPIRAGAGTING